MIVGRGFWIIPVLFRCISWCLFGLGRFLCAACFASKPDLYKQYPPDMCIFRCFLCGLCNWIANWRRCSRLGGNRQPIIGEFFKKRVHFEWSRNIRPSKPRRTFKWGQLVKSVNCHILWFLSKRFGEYVLFLCVDVVLNIVVSNHYHHHACVRS